MTDYQNGQGPIPREERKRQRDEQRRARTGVTAEQTNGALQGLNAISVFGLGKLMPLGNIGLALMREQMIQTTLLKQQISLLESQHALLVEQIALLREQTADPTAIVRSTDDGGHL